MKKFIDSTARELGIPEQTALRATGGALKLLQKHVDAADFAALMSQLDGASDVLQHAPSTGGGLSGFMSKAVSVIGDSAGAKVEALSILQKSGLDLQTARPFFTKLLEYVRSQADPALVERISGQLEHLTS